MYIYPVDNLEIILDIEERIKGRHIEIIPISQEDSEFFFEKATSSDGTPLWYGAKYGDQVPDRETFFKDWNPYYFQDRQNRKGRCFHILQEGNKIGQINYNAIEKDEVDLDIIIYDKEHWSKGYGSSAIKLMSIYLEEKFHVEKIWIDVHPDNARAMKAYNKAGFSNTESSNKSQYVRLMRTNQYL